MILVGTDNGFVQVGADMAVQPAGHRMDAIAVDAGDVWALSDQSDLWQHPEGGDWEIVANLNEGQANCLAVAGDLVLVGAAEARLFRLDGSALKEVTSFGTAPGRDTWGTPWGGPPDVRSIGFDDDGVAYVNVHVGGVLRSAELESWEPTMDISADVHEVIAHSGSPGDVYAASAIGLGVTTDGADSWEFQITGMHAVYCRAVAIGGDYALVSASLGPSGGKAAVYRRPLDGSTPFRKCEDGLPEWFAGNVNTFCLDAVGDRGVIAAPEGAVYESVNGGVTWSMVAEGLPGVHCVALV